MNRGLPINAHSVDPPFRMLIVRLGSSGFLADTSGRILVVGEIYQVSFELSAVRAKISDRVKVVKTYDRPNGAKLAEFHFESPSAEGVSAIRRYMKHFGIKEGA